MYACREPACKETFGVHAVLSLCSAQPTCDLNVKTTCGHWGVVSLQLTDCWKPQISFLNLAHHVAALASCSQAGMYWVQWPVAFHAGSAPRTPDMFRLWKCARKREKKFRWRWAGMPSGRRQGKRPLTLPFGGCALVPTRFLPFPKNALSPRVLACAHDLPQKFL